MHALWSNWGHAMCIQVAADERLARIMGEQAQMVVTARVRTQEEENLKSAILAQYAQVMHLFYLVH